MDNLSKRQKVVKILPPAGGSRLTSWVMWGDTSAAKRGNISLIRNSLNCFLLLFRTNHRLIVSTFPKEISVLI